jgi:hypothetical protein
MRCSGKRHRPTAVDDEIRPAYVRRACPKVAFARVAVRDEVRACDERL